MRRLSQFYAFLRGYFWLPCPICGRMFGGHEVGAARVPTDQPDTFKLACRLHDNSKVGI
jgi:hypothetical protein